MLCMGTSHDSHDIDDQEWIRSWMTVCQPEWCCGFHVESQEWVLLRNPFFALDPLPEVWRCSNARCCWPEGKPHFACTVLQTWFCVAVNLPRNLHRFNAFQRSTTPSVMVVQEAALESRGKLKLQRVKLWRNCQIVQQLGDTADYRFQEVPSLHLCDDLLVGIHGLRL